MLRLDEAGELSFSCVQVDLSGTDTLVAEQARDVNHSYPCLKHVRGRTCSHGVELDRLGSGLPAGFPDRPGESPSRKRSSSLVADKHVVMTGFAGTRVTDLAYVAVHPLDRGGANRYDPVLPVLRLLDEEHSLRYVDLRELECSDLPRPQRRRVGKLEDRPCPKADRG